MAAPVLGAREQRVVGGLVSAAVFAVAFGWVEAAVVVYLRALVYPDGFALPLRPIAPSIAVVELELPATRFYPVTPCRLFDTREAAGPLGGPAISAGARRLFPLGGTCGIPPGARAISTNVTVVAAGAAGSIVLWAGDGEIPGTSNVNVAAGRTRANNGVIELARDGTRTIQVLNGAAAAAHLILDVNGYFQ